VKVFSGAEFWVAGADDEFGVVDFHAARASLSLDGEAVDENSGGFAVVRCGKVIPFSGDKGVRCPEHGDVPPGVISGSGLPSIIRDRSRKFSFSAEVFFLIKELM